MLIRRPFVFLRKQEEDIEIVAAEIHRRAWMPRCRWGSHQGSPITLAGRRPLYRHSCFSFEQTKSNFMRMVVGHGHDAGKRRRWSTRALPGHTPAGVVSMSLRCVMLITYRSEHTAQNIPARLVMIDRRYSAITVRSLIGHGRAPTL